MTRLLIGVAGTAVAAYGGWLLLGTQDTAEVLAVAVWFAAGIVLHDVVLAPLTLGVDRLAERVLPAPAAAGAAVALVVLGPVSLVAVPVLVRSATTDPTNPTVLVRDYPLGWLELAAAAAVLAAVVATSVLRSEQARRRHGADPGRR